MSCALDCRAIAMAIALQVCLLAFPQGSYTLDTTFRTQIEQRFISSVVLLQNGDVLLSGNVRFPNDFSDRLLAKVDSVGEQVLSFPFSYGGEQLTPWLDRIYVGAGVVRRLLNTGLLDPSFIDMNLGPYFSSSAVGSYHVYQDGRILMSGLHTLSDTARGFVGNHCLIWFSNEGYLDTTRTHRSGNGPIFYFKEVTDGKFLCSGSLSQYEGHAVDRLFRVEPDGTLDTTFNSHVYLGGAKDYLALPDGRAYAVGRYWRTDATTETIWVGRFMPDGSLDPTWNSPQFDAPAYIPDPNGATVWSIKPWGTSGVVVCGEFNAVNGEERWGICVLDSTGLVLPPFNNCEIGPTTWFSSTNVGMKGITFTPDSAHCYVYGFYEGLDDGAVNDTAQGFISRLHVGDIGMTSSRQRSEAGAFEVYPNPASGTAMLKLEKVQSDAQLVLRDALGREAIHLRVSALTTAIDLHSLGEGLYFVELRSREQCVGMQRLLVQH
ncbi:MAG: T9SS type A sorting domain-containing protein [Flavobacteriales bacterium]|nr:T9SS type A sorting domain-containing protein [Flavobacteriales bacterium]